jgi:hypothetical protein
MTEITRFEMDMDGSMEPSEHGEWVRYEDAQRELDSQYKLGMEAERNKLASWMMAQGYATGHGDTIEGLLEELGGQAIIRMVRVAEERVKAERDACLSCIKPNATPMEVAAAIRARTQA